jgi:hypothetical protein
VFASRRGTRLDSSNIAARVFKPAAKRAGVPWAGFHTFRHTYATMLFRHGLNAKQGSNVARALACVHALSLRPLLPDDLPDASFLDRVTTRDPRQALELASAHRREALNTLLRQPEEGEAVTFDRWQRSSR